MTGRHVPAATETIGGRLRRLRVAHGLSQRELASEGVSYAYISRLERDERRPSVRALRQIAQKLGVSATYLETGHDLTAAQLLELRLCDAEIELRLSDDTRQAERELVRIVGEAEELQDHDLVVRASAALGLAAFHRGDHGTAVDRLEAVVDQLSPAEHPDCFGTLARAYVGLGRTDDAVDLLASALTAAHRAAPANPILTVRYATLLSYALSEVGDLSAARDVVAYALEQAHESEDPYTRVRTYWSEARLAAIAGDAQTALASLNRAVSLLETTEDARQLGRAHLLWAEILTFDGRAGEAVPHLRDAKRLLGRKPAAEDLYWLRTEQARAEAQLGLVEKAIAHGEQALALIGDTDPAEQGAAHLALGEAHAKSGDHTTALEHLERSVQLLTAQRVWRDAAEAYRLLAETLDAAGQPTEAARVRATREVATHLEAAPSGRRITLPPSSPTAIA